MSKGTGFFRQAGRAGAPFWWFAPRSLAVLLCSAAIVAASGCTTVRTIETPAEQGGWAEMRKGEPVKLSLYDGRELDLEFVEWTDQDFIGRDGQGSTVEIAHADIASVRVRRTSPARTTVLLTVVAVVALLTVAASDFDLPWNQPPVF